MSHPTLTREGIEAAVNIAVEHSVARTVLLGHLPRQLTARLPNQANDFDQLVSDLTALVALGDHGLSEPPATTWLRNLAFLVSAYPTARQRVLGLIGVSGAHVDISRISQYAPKVMVGREAELALLDDAWAAEGAPRVLVFEAVGGEGKTALLAHWLNGQAAQSWPGARAVFAWSFYSQGAREQAEVSSDAFLAAALRFFGDAPMATSPVHAVDKARRLAELVRTQRALLVLDGLEPLQFSPRNPLRGQLKDKAIAALLRMLATQGQALCLVSTRTSVADLAGLAPNVQTRALEGLSGPAGVDLLTRLGVTGPAAELEAAVAEVKGHALTLTLLGRYLADAFGGDVRRRDQVDWHEADEEAGGHAWRVMDRYVAWFEAEGMAGVQTMALLRLLGLFDRPTEATLINALRDPPVPGLTDALAGMRPYKRNIALKRLESARLLMVAWDHDEPLRYDAHPLVREYFAHRLQTQAPAAWQAAHGRLFEYLCEHTEHQPSTPEGLAPLYQAVAHGCLAGRHKEACISVYIGRILREPGSNGSFSTKHLGLVAADLGAVACFFRPPWKRASGGLGPGIQLWLQNEAAYALRSLGRLHEALEPAKAALAGAEMTKDWENAAVCATNLSQLKLSMGDIGAAIEDAKRAVAYARRSGNVDRIVVELTTAANAFHQAGRHADAKAGYEAALALQKRAHPGEHWLYSLHGFQYCAFLLHPAERAAHHGRAKSNAKAACRLVAKRVDSTLSTKDYTSALLDLALDHLSLGRVALYRACCSASPAPRATARKQIEAAVAGLRRASTQQFLAEGLLSRAWLRTLDGQPQGAIHDLDEAWDIALHGEMRLHQADVHLYRARLFHTAADYPWDSPAADLAAARALIEACGYGRRLPELADLEAALGRA